MVENHVSRTCAGVYRAVDPVVLLYRLIQSHSDPKTETWTDHDRGAGLNVMMSHPGLSHMGLKHDRNLSVAQSDEIAQGGMCNPCSGMRPHYR